MLSYCLKCREKADSKNPRVGKTKKERILIVSSKSTVCNSKNSRRFIRKEEAKGLLSLISKIPILSLLLIQL